MTRMPDQWRGSHRKFVLCFIAGVISLAMSNTVTASPASIQNASGIRISIEVDGSYTIISSSPAWSFGGSVGKPVGNITTTGGVDGIGAYDEITFGYIDSTARQAGIRLYKDKREVLFTLKYLEAGINDFSFPSLSRYPRLPLHITYDAQFAQYSFSQLSPASPWIFFDPSGSAFIISPASNFMTAAISPGPQGELTSSIDRSIFRVPSGFTHQTLLIIEEGVNRAFDSWGKALTDLQGKKRPANDADTGLKYLGYWTDNGATYYYDYDLGLGYQGTLLAMRDYFRRENIPIGYMQLDSWWYPKGRDAHWTRGDGIFRYIAHPDIFPDGLKSFQQKLGLPLITHSRWIDPNSPYRQEYRISNNVSIDPRYWDNAIGYIKDAGVISYEQDWLENDATAALEDQDAYLTQMSRACSDRGLTMQYCMATPRHFLQTSKYSNLTTIRVSGDRFNRGRWDAFLYSSRLASALGVWPWTDVFMSYETSNLLLANLSAGMVGIGDRIGTTDKSGLFRVIRKDGVIVKPDAPIVPSDRTFASEAAGSAAPMIAYTYTDHGSLRSGYVFAYDRGAGPDIMFEPWTFGIKGKTFVYNYLSKNGRVVEQHSAFRDTFTTSEAYYLAAPIGPSGIAFIGDEGKFVSNGKQRISDLSDDGIVHVNVTFARDEDSVSIIGYAPARPAIQALKGSAAALTYDRSTHLFRFSISPDSDLTATVDIIPAASRVVPVAGLTGEYCSGLKLDDLRLSRIDKAINFDWDGPPDSSIDSMAYSVRWSGKLAPKNSDLYTFYAASSGGGRLWVNGLLVIDNWTGGAQTEASGSIQLVGGQLYDIRMECFNQAVHGFARLSWSSTAIDKQIIPKKRLVTARTVFD